MKDFSTTLEKIKSRAYWKVEVYPAHYGSNIFRTSQLPDLVKETSLQFRGWDYPHFVSHAMENRCDRYPIDGNRVEAWIDWANHKEIWRVYRSGKFTHLFSVSEQWFDEYDENWGPTRWASDTALQTSMDAIGIVYKVTEIIEFLGNFTQKFPDNDEFIIKISIHNSSQNKLVVLQPGRIGLSADYVNRSDNIVAHDGKILKGELANQEARFELGNQVIEEIFDYFDWRMSPGLIRAEQHKLVSGQI